jgi:hypothetical protein
MLTTSSETIEDLRKWKVVHDLWDFYLRFTLILVVATPDESSLVQTFIQTYLRANPENPLLLNPSKFDTIYESFINSARITKDSPALKHSSAQVMEVTVGGKTVPMNRKKQQAFIAFMNSGAKGPGGGGGGGHHPPHKKTKTQHGDKTNLLCTWCKKPSNSIL